MIAGMRSVLHLTWLSARFSVGRLVGITVGVALGVALILLLAGAAQGLNARDHRAAWLREQGQSSVEVPSAEDGVTAEGDSTPVAPTNNSVLVDPVDGVFGGQLVHQRVIAATPDSTVQIPGVGGAPEPGTYYASPALEELIRTTDPDQLGQRFGTFAGLIDDSALAGPDSLVVVSGATEADLRSRSRAPSLVSHFTDQPYGDSATAFTTLIAVGAITALFPVLLLINISTQWGAAARAERLGVLGLMGATPRTLAAISATEALVTTALGALLGVLLARVLRPVAASIPAGDSRLFVDDLALGAGATTALVCVVIVTATGLAASRAGAWRRSRTGIGTTAHEPRATIKSAVPLIVGLVMVAASARLGPPEGTTFTPAPYLQIGGFLLTVLGMVLIGPLLVRAVSAMYVKRARGPAAIIAGHRMARHPASTYRAVSGLVIAVFAVSVFAGMASSVSAPRTPSDTAGVLPTRSVYAWVDADVPAADVRAQAQRALETNGVTSAVVAYGTTPYGSPEADQEWFVPSRQLRDLGFDGAPDGPLAAVDTTFFSNWNGVPQEPRAAPGHSIDTLVPTVLVLGTDGSEAALDRARTLLITSAAVAAPPMSKSDDPVTWTTRLIAPLSFLANLGMFVAVVIAGLSLAVSTAASILERKRVFGMLRLMGTPLSLLRGVVIREAVIPLLTVVLVVAGLGYLTAALMVEGIDQSRSVTWPGATYVYTLALSAALALVAVLAACGLLRQHRNVSVTRFE